MTTEGQEGDDGVAVAGDKGSDDRKIDPLVLFHSRWGWLRTPERQRGVGWWLWGLPHNPEGLLPFVARARAQQLLSTLLGLLDNGSHEYPVFLLVLLPSILPFAVVVVVVIVKVDIRLPTSTRVFRVSLRYKTTPVVELESSTTSSRTTRAS